MTIADGEGKLDAEVLIIGAGLGGITAAYHLRSKGITDLLILERASNIGGTWRDNHYPGLEVDIPSLWYQFSFAPNPNWSKFFAPGVEVYHYLTRTVDELGLTPLIRTESEVVQQIWDDQSGTWTLRLRSGETLRSRYVINAVGGYLNAKASTDLEGLDDFEGTVLRPNAWDDEYDLTDKNVAIIGTGSSGAQIAGAISGKVASLHVFQRTATWVLPKINFTMPRWLNKMLRIPGVLRAIVAVGDYAMDSQYVPLFHIMPRLPESFTRNAMSVYDSFYRLLFRFWLLVALRDKATRKALVPKSGLQAKRPVICTAYVRAFNHPTTHLVTTAIDRVTAHGVRTVDGTEYPADLLVTATGYDLFIDPESYRPGTIIGRHGFDLADEYRRNGIRSYNGSARPELPNRWDLVGALGYQGIAWFQWVDAIATHVVRIITEAKSRNAAVTSVTRAAFDRWNQDIARRGKAVRLYFDLEQNRKSNSRTYFINSQGEALFYRPQTMTGTRRFCRRAPVSDYCFEYL
ncbi:MULTISPECIES: flavin-containing monooxygenase [Mycobacterium]|uniref:Monooxygenase n=1 Tax=Mycobacterium kiyosense TaxID=2871094 RepID=A0A9P3Q5W7_9MYCO|nr:MULTISPECIES: NAD(P)/FAD-dependent oxidoreductase [Mycobacterium]BDB40475.1 putative monooxygenase [Mycobacterium kiyosense]BDE12293.1 putative monooxygenase [Mycobacterium sp. 20KCMC460]GLB84122.1 putative monooxygenase [Mycobacterium kiyosense]GLB88531.1 putative monooxygenase [Mycobacterium kiyosense]GLB94840.1 putative monooxygenase [Mycobacterium kiyosense]